MLISLILFTISITASHGVTILEGSIYGQQSLSYHIDANEVNQPLLPQEQYVNGRSPISNHQRTSPRLYSPIVDDNANRMLQSKKYHRRKLNAKNKDKAAARGWMIAFLFTFIGLIIFIVYYRRCKLKWQLQMLQCNDECEESLNDAIGCNTPLLDDALPVLISNGYHNDNKAVL